MCGIWSFISLIKQNVNYFKLFKDFMNLKHRGPDHTVFNIFGKDNDTFVGFHRLAVIDNDLKSNQPFIVNNENGETIIFMCNGEIYNYAYLQTKYKLSDKHGDCYTLLELYINLPLSEFLELFNYEIQGEFAFVLYVFNQNGKLNKLILGRDQVGVRPLYINNNQNNHIYVASEIKSMLAFNDIIEEFPPGTIKMYNFLMINEISLPTITNFTFKNIYLTKPKMCDEEEFLLNLRKSVINSVEKRICYNQPVAFLVSGGVDSSLVAGIASKIYGEDKPLNTFCCGLKYTHNDVPQEGTDLYYARKVAKHIGSNHTEVLFTPEEGIELIEEVIRTIESWDVTTIRASIPQYIVLRHIAQNTDAKVVYVGEGTDEVLSSYMFNWYAPDGEALHQAALEYVDKIHYYDVKRVDRCVSRWSLEARVALLDPEFIINSWQIPADYRLPVYQNMEKWWIRKAFELHNIIPKEVLWRTKTAFSDGVSSIKKSWFEILQDYVETKVCDDEFNKAIYIYPENTPKTKEAYFYRRTFCKFFGEHNQTCIPNYWQPKWGNDKKLINEYIDPSARVLDITKILEK